MNKVGQILLLVGALVLALLIGVLIGRRGAHAPEMAVEPAGVQISTDTPVGPPAATTPLEAPVQAPPTPAPPPPARVAPDVQVQEDAAAVGMTTREEASDEAKPADAPAEAPVQPAPADGDPPN